MSEVNGDQFLRVWEIAKILAGDVKPLSEFRFGQSVPESFVFSRDGRYLYGSSYYTGVSNIFRYEVATGEVEAVSNAETGFFRPVPLADGRLRGAELHRRGLRPGDHRAAAAQGRRARSRSSAPRSRRSIRWSRPGRCRRRAPSTTRSSSPAKGPYDPAARASRSPTPIRCCRATRSTSAIGYHVNIEDPLRFAKLGITAAYTPTGNLPAQRARPRRTSPALPRLARGAVVEPLGLLRPVRPDQAQPQGLRRQARLRRLLIYDEPRKLRRQTYDLAYYDKIDTLPDAQNVDTTFTRLVTGEVGLHYTDVRRSLGAVDDEKGVAWSLVAKATRRTGEITPQIRGTLDFGFPLPLPHSSIWLRSAAGVANGDRNNPLANFYFGGFGNNYVDSRTVKRYREYDSFPGFEIDEISGLSFVRQMVEWNLPPVVFESVGTPSFHLTWLRPGGVRLAPVDRRRELVASPELRERRRAGRPASSASCTGTT